MLPTGEDGNTDQEVSLPSSVYGELNLSYSVVLCSNVSKVLLYASLIYLLCRDCIDSCSILICHSLRKMMTVQRHNCMNDCVLLKAT